METPVFLVNKKRKKDVLAKKKDQKGASDITSSFENLLERFSQTKEEEFIESGSFIFDTILSNGKGIPKGTMIEVASEAGIGKTTLFLTIARHLCSQGKRVVYIDSEMGVNDEMLKSFGMYEYKKNNLFLLFSVCVFDDIEDILNVALDKKNDVSVVMVDSITQLIPQSIIDNLLSDSRQIGLQARNLDLFFKKYKILAKKSNIPFLFINQFRTNINALHPGNNAAGGNALKHSMDVRVVLKKRFQNGDIKAKIPGDSENETQVIGSACEIKATKNRYANPEIKRDIFILFGKGVSNSESFISWLTNKGYLTKSGPRLKLEIPGMEEKSFKGHKDVYNWLNEVDNFETVRKFILENGWFYLKAPDGTEPCQDDSEDEADE